MSAILLLLSLWAFIKAQELSFNKIDNQDGSLEKLPSPSKTSFWEMLKIKPAYTALILFAAVTILMIILQLSIIGDNYSCSDEFSYYLQSKILLTGRLYADSLEPLDAFQTTNIVNNGKWFSKYTIGWPLLLSIGTLLNIPWLVNCFLAGGAAGILFLLGKEIYDYQTGLIASILLLISPMLVFNSITMLPHIAHLLFILLFALFFFKAIKSKSITVCSFFSGISLGAAILVRPAESILCGLSFFLYVIFLILSDKENRLNIIKNFCAAILAFLPVLFFALWVNKEQTGSYTTFAFLVFDDQEKWGMGTYGHNAYRGIWNTLISVFRLFIWVPILTIEASIISLWEKRKENYLFFIFAVMIVCFYFFYYSLGVIEYGPRYYFVFIGFLMLLAARGFILTLQKIAVKVPLFKKIGAVILAIAIFMLTASYPAITHRTIKQTKYMTVNQASRLLEQYSAEYGKILVFVRNIPGYTVNLPDTNDDIIIALFLDPKTNSQVIQAFKEKQRHIFIMNYIETDNSVKMTPYDQKPFEEKDNNIKIAELLVAAYNYAHTVRNWEKALELMDEALKISPHNHQLTIQKAAVLMELNRYDEAAGIFEGIIKQDPQSELNFLLGICYKKTGDNAKALEAFSKAASSRGSMGGHRAKAESWVEYLSKKQ